MTSRQNTVRKVPGSPPHESGAKNSAKQGGDIHFLAADPWQESVDGAALLDELCATFSAHAVLPPGAPEAFALWTLNTYVFDAHDFLPILLIGSPEKRCGKSTVLKLLRFLCHRVLPVSNIPPAALFRMIDKCRPTLLIDEADTFLKENEELRGVVNSGHSRDFAYVVRCVGEDYEPRTFSTWAPKAIAMIGTAPDTIADRSVRVSLRRKLPDEKVSRVDGRDKCFPSLRSKCARWAQDNLCILQQTSPVPLDTGNDRAADNWSALLGIAEVAGGNWPIRAREAAGQLSGNEGEEQILSTGVRLLIDIQEVFTSSRRDRLATVDIINGLVRIEDSPWAEWCHGRQMTPSQMAKHLKPFGLKPKVYRFGGETSRGYELTDFQDAFARYLPEPSVTPQQVNENSLLDGSPSVTTVNGVTGQESPNELELQACYSVTAQEGEGVDEWSVVEFGEDHQAPAEAPESSQTGEPTRICFCCRGSDFWQSAHDPERWVCRRCHPPAPGAERSE